MQKHERPWRQVERFRNDINKICSRARVTMERGGWFDRATETSIVMVENIGQTIRPNQMYKVTIYVLGLRSTRRMRQLAKCPTREMLQRRNAPTIYFCCIHSDFDLARKYSRECNRPYCMHTITTDMQRKIQVTRNSVR